MVGKDDSKDEWKASKNTYQMLARTWHPVGGPPSNSGVTLAELARDPHLRLHLVSHNSSKNLFVNALFHSGLVHVRFVKRALEPVPKFICEHRVSPSGCHCRRTRATGSC